MSLKKQASTIRDTRAKERTQWKMAKYFEQNEAQSTSRDDDASQEPLTFEQVESLIQPETPLEKAQDLVWRAFNEPTKRKRIAMAKDALKLSPDCADAYVVLAENESKNIDEAEQLYKKGVEAGRRALGDLTNKNLERYFWKDLETRPFMRCVYGLAEVLHDSDRTNEAIGLWNELLRLNPPDNLNVHVQLIPALVQTGKLAEADKLLEQYRNESSPALCYSRALMLFKQDGDTEESRTALYKAMDINRFTIQKMLNFDKKNFSHSSKDLIHDKHEALSYLLHAYNDWLNTEGALDWVITVVEEGVQRLQQNIQLAETFPGLQHIDDAPNMLEVFGQSQQE